MCIYIYIYIYIQVHLKKIEYRAKVKLSFILDSVRQVKHFKQFNSLFFYFYFDD